MDSADTRAKQKSDYRRVPELPVGELRAPIRETVNDALREQAPQSRRSDDDAADAYSIRIRRSDLEAAIRRFQQTAYHRVRPHSL